MTFFCKDDEKNSLYFKNEQMALGVVSTEHYEGYNLSLWKQSMKNMKYNDQSPRALACFWTFKRVTQ